MSEKRHWCLEECDRLIEKLENGEITVEEYDWRMDWIEYGSGEEAEYIKMGLIK